MTEHFCPVSVYHAIYSKYIEIYIKYKIYLNKITTKTAVFLFHLEKARSKKCFCFIAHRGHETSNFQTQILLRPCMPNLFRVIHICSKTAVLRQQKTSEKQERKFKTHSKLYMSVLSWWCWWMVAVLIDDLHLSLYALIKTFSLMRSLWYVSTEISLALCLNVCVFPVSDPATYFSYLNLLQYLNTFPKHIQWNVLCAPSKLLAFIHQYWKRKTLLHVNRRIPLVFRAALDLYLDY